MKIYKLFTLALAALAFAACSDDDVVDNGQRGINETDDWQADTESISIDFTNGSDPSTRAYSGTTDSEGTEATIYTAYVFAREANPTHDRPLTGDWTVFECKVTKDKNGNEIVQGSEIKENKDKTVTVKNVAEFHGVRQGDNVYVIANDPNMTFEKASTLAHKGLESEANIKAYTSALSKRYLAALTYRDGQTPTGKYIMAGMAQIPVAPTIGANETLELEVGLDRELSKVNFKAELTTNTADAACGVVEFREGDGIVVARIARKTSMFTERETDFYVPTPTCLENWPFNDHSIKDGVFTSFCDQTTAGSVMFDGLGKDLPLWNGVMLPDSFNVTSPAGEIQEYRYSWVLGKANGEYFGDKDKDMFYGKKNSVTAPMFYVTPNYGKNTNGVTVICTQASYTGGDVLMNEELVKVLDKTLNFTDRFIEFSNKIKIPNPLYALIKDEAAGDDETNKANIAANEESTKKYLNSLKAVIASRYADAPGLGMRYLKDNTKAPISAKKDTLVALMEATGLDKKKLYLVKENATTKVQEEQKDVILDRDMYDQMMDKFYQALVLQYRTAQTPEAVDGTMLTKLENRIPANTTAYYCDPADPNKNNILPTDYLLLGTADVEYQLYTKKPAKTRTVDYDEYDEGEKVKGAPIFYIFQNQTDPSEANWYWMASDSDFSQGKEARQDYFASEDAFKYFTDMKLYYRADVADYANNVSNKMTERNMYYQTVGEIQSLGARTIHEAIYSDNNTMKVSVKVNKWKLSVNQIPM